MSDIDPDYELVRIYYEDSMTQDELDKAMECRPCRGRGHVLHFPDRVCPACDGDAISRDKGWTYLARKEWALAPGDKVVIPPTPQTDENQIVTVVGIGFKFRIKSRLVKILYPWDEL